MLVYDVCDKFDRLNSVLIITKIAESFLFLFCLRQGVLKDCRLLLLTAWRGGGSDVSSLGPDALSSNGFNCHRLKTKRGACQ